MAVRSPLHLHLLLLLVLLLLVLVHGALVFSLACEDQGQQVLANDVRLCDVVGRLPLCVVPSGVAALLHEVPAQIHVSVLGRKVQRGVLLAVQARRVDAALQEQVERKPVVVPARNVYGAPAALAQLAHISRCHQLLYFLMAVVLDRQEELIVPLDRRKYLTHNALEKTRKHRCSV